MHQSMKASIVPQPSLLARQHGLADDVAYGEDLGHVGAHLDVDVNEAAVCH